MCDSVSTKKGMEGSVSFHTITEKHVCFWNMFCCVADIAKWAYLKFQIISVFAFLKKKFAALHENEGKCP